LDLKSEGSGFLGVFRGGAKVTRLWLQPTSQVAAVGCLLHKEKQLLLYKTQVVYEAPIIIYNVLKSRPFLKMFMIQEGI